MLTPALAPTVRTRRWRILSRLLATTRDPLSTTRPTTPNQSGARTETPRLRDFERFFLDHEARVSGYLWRMTGDQQTACDLSQETFLRAWQRFDTISAYERPDAWLIRVATNLALQYLRWRRAPVGAAVSLDEALDPGVSDPGQRFARRDLVRETLMELPARARALLVLREVYGLSGAETAAALGMTPTAAKVALFRARERFRVTYLEKDGPR
ncbi:MAG: RNA polymerase sigma factor [Ktedonobacterales bacterium]